MNIFAKMPISESQIMEDLRIRRTKRSIENAMMDLIEIKGFNKVRLVDVAEKAMVNRNTIYLHYQSKEEIVMSIINRSFSENFIALDAARVFTGRPNKQKLRKLFDKMLNILESNIDLYRIFLIDSNLIGYLQDSIDKVKDLVYKTLKPSNKNRLGVEYIVNGIYGTIARWIIYATGKKEDIVNILTDFTYLNIRHLLLTR